MEKEGKRWGSATCQAERAGELERKSKKETILGKDRRQDRNFIISVETKLNILGRGFT